MRGAIPHSPNTPSWRVAQSTGTILPLSLPYYTDTPGGLKKTTKTSPAGSLANCNEYIGIYYSDCFLNSCVHVYICIYIALYSSVQILEEFTRIFYRKFICPHTLWTARFVSQLRNAYRILVGKPERKRPLGRSRHCWEDNIRIDPREMGWEGVEWMHLAHDREQWRAVVNTVMNFRVL